MPAIIEAPVISVPWDLAVKAEVQGGHRYLFLEASSDAWDMQNERVFQRALEESKDYFLRFGNIDLDHKTLLADQLHLENAYEYEIGKPVEVAVGKHRTFVKAEIYSGEGASAQMANFFWDSLTKQAPPATWYPSIGGAVLARRPVMVGGEERRQIEKVRWSNIGLSRTPVNIHLQPAQLNPIGGLSKSFAGGVMSPGEVGEALCCKTLTAGYGTDTATLTGGGAMREESLDGKVKKDLREALASRGNESRKTVIRRYFRRLGYSEGAVRRFLTNHLQGV